MKTNEIQIRDPYIYVHRQEPGYYLFGTTDKNCWNGLGVGFDCYQSFDLINWEGPIAAFRPKPGFWATHNFWAPEVHFFKGRYYLLASFIAQRRFRGTQIFVADRIIGPYQPLTDGPITPENWQCLDGTLHIDADGKPWIVFCQEWVQVHDGSMWAMPLTEDLTRPMGRPIFLFNASEASWAYRSGWHGMGQPSQLPPYLSVPDLKSSFDYPLYVTDGPFLHQIENGALSMIWSSLGHEGYTMGVAYSESGKVTGPWKQSEDAIWTKDGGHGMIFRDLEGKLKVSLHQPNDTPNERAIFVEIDETGSTVRLKSNGQEIVR